MPNKYTPTAHGKYECPQCGEEKTSPQALGAHIRYKHAKRTPTRHTAAPRTRRRLSSDDGTIATTALRVGLMTEMRGLTDNQVQRVMELILECRGKTLGV